MNIELIKNIDIGRLAVYGKRNMLHLTLEDVRKACIENEENIGHKDLIYEHAKLIIENMINGCDSSLMKRKVVIELLSKFDFSMLKVIEIVDVAHGMQGVMVRGEIYNRLCGMERGNAIIAKSVESDGEAFECFVSNGAGHVYSSKKAGFVLRELPSKNNCAVSLLSGEYDEALNLIEREINYQSNIAKIKELGLKVGETIDKAYKDSGYIRKILIKSISASGLVTFEVITPGKSARKVKEVEARFLGDSA